MSDAPFLTLLHRGEGAEGVADEVGVAGGVDQVDLLAGPFEVEEVAVDGEVPALLLVLDVADARAVVDGAAGDEAQEALVLMRVEVGADVLLDELARHQK